MKQPESYPDIFVVTGAESTGKSTLCQNLAEYYNAIFIPEFARDYVVGLNRKYNYSDVEKIALMQVDQYNEALVSGAKLVFLDTWLIITKVWFEVVYNKVPEWMDTIISNSKVKGFLLCDIDIPWIADSVRENGGKKREKLHEYYKKNLELFNLNYYIISGEGNKRNENAIFAIDNYF